MSNYKSFPEQERYKAKQKSVQNSISHGTIAAETSSAHKHQKLQPEDGDGALKTAHILEHDEFWTTDDIVKDSQMSKSFYEKKRVTGGGPPFVRIGRAVRYPKSLYKKWLGQHALFYSTSQADLEA